MPDRRTTAELSGELRNMATTCNRPCSRAITKCASSKRKSSGPVLAVTTFKDAADAWPSPTTPLYGLGAGVWSRDMNIAYRMGRGIKAGRVWTNCYHLYPARRLRRLPIRHRPGKRIE